MDKNQLTGLLLIFALLLGWTWFSAPSAEEIAKKQRFQDSIEQVNRLELEDNVLEGTAVTAPEPVNDSVANAALKTSFGTLGDFAVGTEKLSTLENEDVKITFSNKGGTIKEVLLKKFKKSLTDSLGENYKLDLKLLEDANNTFNYTLGTAGKNINTEDLYFTASTGADQIEFTVQTSNGGYFTQLYKLNNGYDVDYKVSFSGFESTGKDQESIKLNWVNHLDKLEQNEMFEQSYSTIYFKEKVDGDTDYCSCRGADEIEKDVTIEWVSHVNQFFNTSLMTKSTPFSYATMETIIVDEDSPNLKTLKTEVGIPNSSGGGFDMNMYIGPNEFKDLQAYDNDLEQIIPFGTSLFGTINRWIVRPSFDFLSQYIGSKGLVIIVLIFILKMLLYPLMYKMLYSQAKMQALKPQIEKLTEKFKEDPQKKQVESMKIYREYGTSPFGGCMPMVIQMPIWYALFRFFPASITFRQEPFLWAADLSSYDVFFQLPFEIPFMGSHLSLFTLLWATTTIIYTYYNTKHMDMSANPAMKYVQYFMPLTFLVFFNNYASGLTCYMFFSNLFNILQTVITRKFVFDNDKILAELEEKKVINKKKPKKKGFQARIEEAMRQQQEMQKKKDQRKGNNKK